MADISLHDNFILSYLVDAQLREIELKTAFFDQEPHEYPDVMFSAGAEAYHLSVMISRQSFSILARLLWVQIIESNKRPIHVDLEKYGWPMNYESEAQLVHVMQEKGVKGFLIESSCGLSGWVWAQDMRVTCRFQKSTQSEMSKSLL